MSYIEHCAGWESGSYAMARAMNWYGGREKNRRTLIARHRGEVPTGTLHRILRDLGLTLDDFHRR